MGKDPVALMSAGGCQLPWVRMTFATPATKLSRVEMTGASRMEPRKAPARLGRRYGRGTTGAVMNSAGPGLRTRGGRQGDPGQTVPRYRLARGSAGSGRQHWQGFSERELCPVHHLTIHHLFTWVISPSDVTDCSNRLQLRGRAHPFRASLDSVPNAASRVQGNQPPFIELGLIPARHHVVLGPCRSRRTLCSWTIGCGIGPRDERSRSAAGRNVTTSFAMSTVVYTRAQIAAPSDLDGW